VSYPDWYEGPKDSARSKKLTRSAANVHSNSVNSRMDTPLEETGNTTMFIGQHHTDTNLLQVLDYEMMKLMKGKQPAE